MIPTPYPPSDASKAVVTDQTTVQPKSITPKPATLLGFDTIQIVAGLRRINEELRTAFKPFAQWLNDHRQELGALATLLSTEEGVDALFRQMFEQYDQPMRLLLSNGWYPIAGTPEYYEWASRVVREHPEQIDKLMCDAVAAALPNIEEDLCTRFPARADIFKAAIEAHRMGGYALSIPTLHAQAEGMSFDLLDAMLYTRTSSATTVPRALRSAENDLSWLDRFVFFALLEKTSPLTRNCNFAEPGTGAEQANRHRVLHGQSTDYATHAHGCRVLSYVAYLCKVLPHVKKSGVEASRPPPSLPTALG